VEEAVVVSMVAIGDLMVEVLVEVIFMQGVAVQVAQLVKAMQGVVDMIQAFGLSQVAEVAELAALEQMGRPVKVVMAVLGYNLILLAH
jgi:hypothetical protein